ncbi:MAG: TlyA family RNA methyltransferase [Kiritimatiellae bacterium]|nr:TlyA family RNA methyltransferase [Kiritimatiellia bacterium]MDD5520658.1 TlyA family RNA methyltransferase [Kiritimatiellia bacterium]
MKKERLDVLLTDRGLTESREQAQRLVGAGKVRIAGQVVTKPGHKYNTDTSIEIDAPQRFVSRGGEKLEAAFCGFDLNVNGLVCIDVGSSTGGFTDCLLQHGALKVYAVDVGKGQLHWKLRNDPRVLVMEGINARYLNSDSLPEKPAFAVVDVSFISLTKILPAVINILAMGAGIVALIKPQFEAGREQVEKGGVVRDENVRKSVVERIREFVTKEMGLKWIGLCESPLKGPAGNVEFLACLKKS